MDKVLIMDIAARILWAVSFALLSAQVTASVAASKYAVLWIGGASTIAAITGTTCWIQARIWS